MKTIEALTAIAALVTWLAFVAACAAHALYHFKAAAQLRQQPPPSYYWVPQQQQQPAQPPAVIDGRR